MKPHERELRKEASEREGNARTTERRAKRRTAHRQEAEAEATTLELDRLLGIDPSKDA